MSASPLRDAIMNGMREHGCSMKDLTVLANQNDPFRIDTPAGHRDGQWLAMHVEQMGLSGRRIHLRGLHYRLMSIAPTKPNGETYVNTDADWRWVQEKAADAARWLGYLEFDQIVDRNNAPPLQRIFEPSTPGSYLHIGLEVDVPDADDLEPYVGVTGFEGVQPYKLVMIGEKSDLEEVLGPIAQDYQADLYLPRGELSDTLIHDMARIGAADGRPMVVLYFSDCDPSGWQMPISTARKLQAFRALKFDNLEFEVYRVALTPDQVRAHGLPSSPLKPTEKRAGRWQQAMEVAQTEIDALAALQPGLLRQLTLAAIAPFYDTTLDRRVFEAKSRWLERAQQAVDEAMDSDHLQRIRAEADTKLTELREQIDAINQALQIDTSGIALPELVVPGPQLNGRSNGSPLLDSRWTFMDQCERLIASKSYDLRGAA
jgi:hypothetical protein